jgi:hypothetical protein
MTDMDDYELEIDTIGVYDEITRISMIGHKNDSPLSVWIEKDQLDAVIRTLCAVRNARHYGLGLRELHIITKGDYKGVLCMLSDGEFLPGLQGCHLVEFDKGWICPPIAKATILPMDFLVPFSTHLKEVSV